MKVLHIITSLDVGGAEMMLLKIAAEHKRAGIFVSVANLGAPGQVGQRLEAEGIPVFNMHIRNPIKFMRSLPRLFVLAFRAQVVQGWMYHGNLFATVVSLLKPSLWNIRGSLYMFKREPFALQTIIFVNRLLSWLPKVIIYNSELAKMQHEELGFSKRRALVIGNGFDTDVFKPAPELRAGVRENWNADQNDFIICHVGRYHRDKDHETFITAAHAFLKIFPAARFVLIGREVDWSNTKLCASIGEAHKGRFILLGERHDIPALLAACDVYTSSSIAEAFSNSIGEAMACALPCVVSKVGDSELLLGDLNWAVLPARPELLVAKWSVLAEFSEAKRKEIGASLRQRILDHYSISKIAGRYLELYSKLVNPTSAR